MFGLYGILLRAGTCFCYLQTWSPLTWLGCALAVLGLTNTFEDWLDVLFVCLPYSERKRDRQIMCETHHVVIVNSYLRYEKVRAPHWKFSKAVLREVAIKLILIKQLLTIQSSFAFLCCLNGVVVLGLGRVRFYLQSALAKSLLLAPCYLCCSSK